MNQALEISTVNSKLFNKQITYAESLRLIFAIRSGYETKVEEIITNQNTNRKFIWIEMDKWYFDIATERINNTIWF